MIRLLLISTFYLLSLVIFSQEHNQVDFVENQGQWNNSIDFKTKIKGGEIYLSQTGLIYDLHSQQDIYEISEMIHHNKDYVLTQENSIINCYSYNVNFVDGKISRYKKINQREYFNNYIKGSDKSKWRGNVPVFEGIIGENIYNKIDFKIYSEGDNLKYDFIVRPRGDYRLIKLDFDGAKNVRLSNEGNLIIETTIGDVIEKKPIVYQFIEGEKLNIEAKYVLEGNVLSFEVGNYNKKHSLIIDPTVIASTYSGSTESIYGHTATFDDAGNIFSAGAGFSPGGLPVSSGAYQVSYAGSREMCINKFNPNGTSKIYSTYLGGSDDDFPHSLFNHNGNLYILGSSSSNDFPTLGSSYDQTYNGGNSDIVVSILNPSGSGLIGSSYVGGSDGDGQNTINSNYGDTYRGEIIVDNNGDCFISSMTSSSDFPVSSNSVQSNHGGFQDGVVFKMNNDLSSLEFSSYLGGAYDDAAYGLVLANNKVYVTGTAGSDFLNGGNAYSYNGGNEAFAIAINNQGNTIMNKTYFGSSDDDQSFFIESDLNGNIYILGQSNGVINSTQGVYDGGDGLFIAKFNPTLDNNDFVSTTNDMAPVAFLVDNCGYIYASGHGGLSSLDNFDISTNAVQNTPAGFYLMVLAPDATSLSYGTYYGSSSSHVDGGTSRFDKRGIVYQATCTNDGFPILSNSFSDNQSGGSYDVTVFKIDFEIASIRAEAVPLPDIKGCVPFSVVFNNTSTGNKYFWDFDDSSPITNEISPTHEFTQTGTYDVKLVAIDSASSCILPDSIYLKIEVNDCINGFDVSDITKKSVFIPNAFSPNDDFVNDIFYVNIKGVINYKLEIFNRWGERLFESSDVEQGWNGEYNGEKVKMDMYVWKVSYTDSEDEKFQYGHVMAVR